MTDYAALPLSRGLFSKIPAVLYDKLAQYMWSAAEVKPGRFYAVRGTRRNNKQKRIYLHREILTLLGISVEGLQVDHINGDKLDNRLSNLRVASARQNNCNTPKRNPKASSQFKGVYWDKRRNAWHARVKFGGCSQSLGFFSDEVEAARKYDAMARHVHGVFAKVNFK